MRKNFHIMLIMAISMFMLISCKKEEQAATGVSTATFIVKRDVNGELIPQEDIEIQIYIRVDANVPYINQGEKSSRETDENGELVVQDLVPDFYYILCYSDNGFEDERVVQVLPGASTINVNID